MNLAKPRVDIGLNTNNLEPMLAFWQNEIGARFDRVLPIRRGVKQHRHDVNGSVLKINHYADALPPSDRAGYRELLIAGTDGPRSLKDPDGNSVHIVAPGTFDINQVGIRIAVADLASQRKFYREALGLEEVAAGRFRAGESMVLLEPSMDASRDATVQGPGWRYMTFQVFKVDEEHTQILSHGGREGLAPITLGTTARISMVRDVDGNWIEISQRASLTGSLE